MGAKIRYVKEHWKLYSKIQMNIIRCEVENNLSNHENS
jgi:hypothetical protein